MSDICKSGDVDNLSSSGLLFLLVVFLWGNTISASATTYFSRANGAWNANATWSTASYGGAAATNYPRAGDIANIGSGNTFKCKCRICVINH